MTVHLFTWFVLCVGDGGVYHERFTTLVLQLNPPPSSLGEIVSLACVSHTYPVLFFFPFHFWDTLLSLAPVSVYTQHLTPTSSHVVSLPWSRTVAFIWWWSFRLFFILCP